VWVQIATLPGAADKPNEDAACADSITVVVVDGVTERTGTGCVHGTAWFAEQLARGVLGADREVGPSDALRHAIARTAALHRATCDLSDPATPCGAIGMVRIGRDGRLRYLALGDVSIVLANDQEHRVVTDERVERTAQALRAEAGSLPSGSAARAAALISMKRAEIAARNKPGGYWVAGADPSVVDHAITGEMAVSDVHRVALLSDGAARAVEPFRLTDWSGALDLLATRGPGELLARVRAAERADPEGTRWPRTKMSDDATAVYCDGLADDARGDPDDDRGDAACASR
jgi:hypothetical protein